MSDKTTILDKTVWHHLYQQSQSQPIDLAAMVSTQFNHQLDLPAQVDSTQSDWVASPAHGVVRILLERDGGEKTTRATSLVAYQPNSRFSAHDHPKGEEFLVLDGTFSDEHGDYPAGTYVRNPPGSSHSPFSQEGCLIFVKLQQFAADDKQHQVSRLSFDEAKSMEGWQQQVLFDGYERVLYCQTERAQLIPVSIACDELEILILKGQLSNGDRRFTAGHWMRFPRDKARNIQAEPDTHLLIKTSHLSLAKYQGAVK